MMIRSNTIILNITLGALVMTLVTLARSVSYDHNALLLQATGVNRVLSELEFDLKQVLKI
jgi:hypothetical protein